MQQFTGRPATRERREDGRRQNVSMESGEAYRERRLSGEPAKYQHPLRTNGVSVGKMICTKDKACDVNTPKDDRSGADRDAKSEEIAKEVPPEQSTICLRTEGPINVSSPKPEGSDNPENKVATSLDNE